MNEPTIDAEQLAALLDGSLNEADRRVLVARLAESPSDLSVFADAAAVVKELGLAEARSSAEPVKKPEAEPGRIPDLRLEPATSQPTRDLPGRRVARRQLDWRWYAVAAAIVGLAVLPWWLARGRRASPDDGVNVVALVDRLEPGLPANWIGRPWNATRGPGDVMTPAARAARLGARLTDLELATRGRRDSVAIGAASDIVELLQEVPASGAATTIFEVIQQAGDTLSPTLLPLVEQGRRAVSSLVDPTRLEEGAWAEASRVAAARQDARFFTSKRIADNLMADRTRPGVAAAMGEMSRHLPASSSTDWSALESAATNVLRALAR